MLAGRLREVGHRVAGDDHRRVGLAAGQRVGGRVFAGIEARIAAAEVDAERIAGPPGDDVVGAGDVAVAAHRLGDEARVGVHVARQGQQRPRCCSACRASSSGPCRRRSRRTWPPSCGPSGPARRPARRRSRPRPAPASSSTPLARARSVHSASKSLRGLIWMKMSAALALLVLRTSTITHVRSLRPLGTNIPLGIRLYLVKCRGWLSAGLRAPEHDQVAAVRDLAERAGHFADALKRHARRAVADAGRRIDACRRSSRRCRRPRAGPRRWYRCRP